MKTQIRSLFISALILFSCDQTEQPKPITRALNSQTNSLEETNQSRQSSVIKNSDLTLHYKSQQPILVGLQSFFPYEGYVRYKLNELPRTGDAEVIDEVFLKYVPSGSGDDYLLLDLVDFNDKTLETKKILFQQGDCGMAQFDRYQIHTNDTLSIDVLTNDNICDRISNMTFVAHAIKPGMNFRTQQAGGINGTPKIILSYVPPAGFTGKVTTIYTAGINKKTEFEDQAGFVNHPEYFGFFASSLIEIEVIN
jgi:hypothetical protein